MVDPVKTYYELNLIPPTFAESMGTLPEADTKSALGVQEVGWQVLPVKDKGEEAGCIAYLILSQANAGELQSKHCK